MTTTTSLPPPSVVPEEIKSSLRSPNTTTSLTLGLVRALLGVDDSSSGAAGADGASKPTSTASKILKTAKTSTATRANKTVAAKRATGRKATFQIHNHAPSRGPTLPVSERRRAAAEIINTTLKTISAAAKARQAAALQPVKDVKGLTRASSPHKPVQPLQEHAPNRPSKPERTASPRDPNNIEGLVQCAEAALDCLRQPVGKDSDSSFDLATENAALAVVDKCLLFHLTSHAETQLRRIHDQYWKRRKQAQPASESTGLFKGLVAFEEDDVKLFRFSTSLQSQCLRLIILADTQTINQECVKALHPDTQGSPAQILQAGQQRGHISAEACASQLRTMALAVSKLYARAAEAPRAWAANSLSLLSLSLTAFHLKALSWGGLGSLPDLQQELWTTLGRSIKQFLAHTRQSEHKSVELYVQTLWTTLQRLHVVDKTPADALNLLQCLSPSLRWSNGQSISPKCHADGDVKDDSTSLAMGMKEAVDILSSEGSAMDQCLAAMESVLSLLKQRRCPEKKKHLTEFLVQSAHLRKATVSTISRLSLNKSSEGSSDVSEEVQHRAALIIYGLLDFFATILDALRLGAETTILLTLAKTVESVVGLEQYSFVRDDGMVAKSRASLLLCLQLRESLDLNPDTNRDSSVRHFFHGLPLRISQYFWSRYRHFSEKRRPADVRLEALNDSIDILQSLDQESQKSGHIVVKYEELCRIFIEQKEYAKARQSLTSAIKHQILHGHLARAVEYALANTQGQLWDDTDSCMHSLGRNLTKYTELSLTIKEDASLFFDQEELPSMQRALLRERQITAMLTSSVPSLSGQQIRSAVCSVVSHSLQTAHSHYRLRFISHILRLLERNNRLSAEQVFDQSIIDAPASSLLEITVRIQWAFACGNLDEATLRQLAAEFSQALDEAGSQCLNTPRTPDINICMSQLRAMSDFAEMLGSSDVQLSVLDGLSKLHSLTKSADSVQHALDLSQRALLLTRDGDGMQAGQLSILIQRLTKDAEMTTYAASTLLLNRAEYLLGIDNCTECSDILGRVDAELAKMECQGSRERSAASKLERESMRCRRTLVASKLAFCRGLLIEAFVDARQAARLSTMLWTAVERASTETAQLRSDALSDSSMQLLTDEMSTMSLQGHQPPGLNLQQQRRAHWTHLSLHRAALMHVGAVAAHCGLYLDAIYYYRQAAQTAEHTAGRAFKTRVDSELALVYAGAENEAMSKAAISDVATSLPAAVPSVEQCHILLNLSEALWLLGDEERARESLARAAAFVKKHRGGAELSAAAAAATSTKKVVKRITSARRPNPRSKAEKPPQSLPSKAAVQSTAHRILHARLEALHYSILHSMEEAPLAREMAKTPNVAVARALRLLEQAKAMFASDPTHSALGETALAFPVRYRPGRKSGQMSLLLQESPATAEWPKDSKSAAVQDNQGCRLLAEAYDCIRDVGRGGELGEMPLSLVHVMHRTLSKLHLLSSALARPLAYSPLPVVLQSLIPKDVARSREQIAIAAEARGKGGAEITVAQQPVDDFGEFVNALPSTWRIVSIGISHDQNELILSKTSTGVSPFLIRVPLARTGFDDLEAHDFTLESAHDQLSDIIARADANTHDPRGQADKATRKEWYAEREALDEEMGTLLKNMEDLWLGGFKGLLAPYTTESSLLARFGQSLNQALDKHLPSRQKASKRAGGVKFDLHARVLELFVSMGVEETAEFEDAITDLLYFVVDTLNLNGESNAVDEVDFDGLLLDVLDAVKAYQRAAEASPTNHHQTVHTILILDKELHGFPWESLPCLRGQPVYRMPSLGAVKERLDGLRQQQSPDGGVAAALAVQRTSGAYILNPAGDLTSTQETFERTLKQQLPDFAAIVNTAPSEEEFKASLSDHDILLYFGHGSGGQYIRGRSIRGLRTEGKRCAVSWLMGCSSVKMTTCGIYEPYGMPWHYINGGAHAVVGTLWDVTDREIDRFAIKALTEWGLLEETDETAKVTEPRRATGKRRERKPVKAKSKTTTTTTGAGKAIGEAVAVARETCFLKYLSGASPVVYGVPVAISG